MRAKAAFLLALSAICSNVGINGAFPADSQLNLRSHLEPFKDCDVNIVQVILTDEPRYGNDLAPLNFPLIYMPLHYTPRKSWGQFRCDERYFDIVRQRFSGNMKVKQNARLNCKALVYIAPKQCEAWYGGNDYLVAVKEHDEFLPIPWKLRNWLSPHNKTGVFLVNGIRSSSFTTVVGNKGTLITPYIRNIYTLLDFNSAVPATFHMKFFFEVNARHHNTIAVVYLLFPPDWGNLNVKCGGSILQQKIELSEPLQICRTVRDVIAYPFKELSHRITIYNVERTLYKAMTNLNQKWLTMCVLCAEIETNAAVTTNMRHWRGQPNLERIILYLLTPNLTVFTTVGMVPFEVQVLKIMQVSGPESTAYTKRVSVWYYFVTCADVATIPRLRLAGYVSSFDGPTWICLIVAAVITSAVLVKFLNRKNLRDALVLPFYVLMEQGYINSAIPCNCRFITGAWFLVGIVLVNLYKRDNIADLTAPLPPEKLKSLQQLVSHNFSYFNIFPASNVVDFNLVFKTLRWAIPKMSINDVNDVMDMPFKAVKPLSFLDQIDSLVEQHYLLEIQKRLIRPTTIRQWILFADKKYFASRLLYCRKEAFIGTYKDTLQVFAALRNKLPTKAQRGLVVKSDQQATQGTFVWQFERVVAPASSWFIRLNSLMQSGILNQWDNWANRTLNWQSMVILEKDKLQSRQPTPMSLNDNGVVIFYLYLVLIGFAALTFCIETASLTYSAICRCLKWFAIFVLSVKSSISQTMLNLYQRCGSYAQKCSRRKRRSSVSTHNPIRIYVKSLTNCSK